MTIDALIDKLITKNNPFAVWSLPECQSPEIITGKITRLSAFHQTNGLEGFVFAPFQITEDLPVFVIKPDIRLKNKQEIEDFDIDSLHEINAKPCVTGDFFITEEAYLDDIRQTINEINETGLSKVIISRSIMKEREKESLGNLYMSLQEIAPEAFIYIVNIPDAGLWMGASPEPLLISHGETMETVSLAGTQSRNPDSEYYWHTKDIEEQAFVSRYMLDVLYRFGITDYTTRGPESMESGTVAHLKTSFRFPAEKIENNLGGFIAALHPTPAVCGLPKEEASAFIQKVEKHNRQYYTGFLGPWKIDGQINLYVNLRCMQITDEQYIIYSGGGITSRSIPEEEWTETGKKAQILLDTINRVK